MSISDSVVLIGDITPNNFISTQDIVTWAKDHPASNSTLPGTPLLYTIPSIHPYYTVKRIALTDEACALLSSSGEVFSWGKQGINGHGETTAAVTIPRRVEGLVSHTITDISAGKQHYICNSSTGKLFSWGTGEFVLGHGQGLSTLSYPTLIQSVYGINFKRVECNDFNSFALTDDGTVYSWGVNASSLGTGGAGKGVPCLINGFSDPVTDIYAGPTHVAAISKSGVYMWGENNFGQCDPNNLELKVVSVPCRVEFTSSQKEVVKAALGSGFSLVLAYDGTIYAWGRNSEGQLGLGHMRSPCHPTLVSALASRRAVDIFAGHMFSSCLIAATKPELFTWGLNTKKVLGHTEEQTLSVPRQVTPNFTSESHISEVYFPRSAKFTAVAVCRSKVSALTESDAKAECLNDIIKLFNDNVHSDLVISVQEKKIFVSKFILCARSEYFRGLFASGMKEEANACVEIEDFSYESVLEMLRFLYSGQATITESNAMSILAVSQKYLIRGLAALAEDYILGHVNTDTAIEIYIASSALNYTHMTENVANYIARHWKAMARHPSLHKLPHDLLLELVQLAASVEDTTNQSDEEVNS